MPAPPPLPEILVETTIKVRVDVTGHTASAVPATVHGAVGTRFTYVLEIANGAGQAKPMAYIAIPDHTILRPDPTTENHEFQGRVYPFQDIDTSVPLRPAFIAVQEGQETPVITVLFPQSDQANLPVSSVVIIDM